MKRHPRNIPIEQWPLGWLQLECASLLKNPLLLMMYDSEKKERNYPVTREEMIQYIKDNKK